MRNGTTSVWLTLFLFLVSIVLLSCGASANKRSDQDSIPSALAKARLGSHYASAFNSSKKYILFQRQGGPDHLRRRIKYLVVRLDDNSVVLEGSFQDGFVKWHDDQSVEVLNRPAVGREGVKTIININRQH